MYLFTRQEFLWLQRKNSLTTIFAYSLSLDFDMNLSIMPSHTNLGMVKRRWCRWSYMGRHIAWEIGLSWTILTRSPQF